MGFNYAAEKKKFETLWARLRREYREVSLSLNRFIALSVAIGYFRMARNRYQPCSP